MGCSNSRFVHQVSPSVNIIKGYNALILQSFTSLNTATVEEYCRSLSDDTDYYLVDRLHCANELLSRRNLSSKQQQFALFSYNDSLHKIIRAQHSGLLQSKKITISYHTFEQFTFAQDITALDIRLTPTIFGEIGIPVTIQRDNTKTGLDKYLPLEGILESASITLSNIETFEDKESLHITLQINHDFSKNQIILGNNNYTIRRSPSSAYLSLIEQADIDEYSWLGFVSAAKAEKRRGIFAINGLSDTKIPVIMIHGLNSDPLIWRHLTIAMLNDPALVAKYQIWHVYYPSGPPPFYNAARLRNNIRELLHNIGNPELNKQAVVIGHSMGGLVANLLTTKTNYELWDATFKQRPEYVVSKQDTIVKDIFTFNPIFEKNTVFFLDTPFKGSDVANSFIGQVGSFLISLPQDFTQIFKRFFDRVGPDILTEKMRPFLINYGPSSVHVLRPGHPLMDALYKLPISGEAYAIIGSNSGVLDCDQNNGCRNISDGVVNYDSANYLHAKERIIVESSHDSFKSAQAIEFILSKLRTK